MLQLINLTKRFVNKGSAESPAVANINLEIRSGEFFSLLGPSGCGKTTLLRMISGLETITSGQILLNGKSIEALSCQERPFNLIFQRYALFPNLTVYENVAFGLSLKGRPKSEIDSKVKEALKLVSMLPYADRGPETLSGGQAQRIAIARALVNEPEILLLDEPLSALDQQLREHMQTELKSLQKKLGLTFIYVTHDQEEALAMSDRIGVMNQGNLEQVSDPQTLFRSPESLFVADFIGTNILMPGELVSHEAQEAVVNVGASILKCGQRSRFNGDKQVWVCIKPEGVEVSRLDRPAMGDSNELRGQIDGMLFKGLHSDIVVRLDSGQEIRVSQGHRDFDQSLKAGDRCRLRFSAQDALCFPRAEP